MTIKEALEKQNYIRVDFIWVNRCNVCKKYYEQEDEEYSFEGNAEAFQEYLIHYEGALDWDDEIQLIKDCHYEYHRDNRFYEETCDECDEKTGGMY